MGAEVNLQDDVGQRVRVLFLCVLEKKKFGFKTNGFLCDVVQTRIEKYTSNFM